MPFDSIAPLTATHLIILRFLLFHRCKLRVPSVFHVAGGGGNPGGHY